MSPPGTLADVLDRIQADASLSKRERQDMAWAIRQTARAVDRPTGDITASPSVLTNRLKTVEPASAGVTKNTWSNVRSLLRKALRQTGSFVHPGQHKGEMSAEWQDLLETIQVTWLRHGLSRFGHFCSDNGWAPTDVGDEHFASFRQALKRSISPNPERAFHRTCVNWNRCVREVPGWPQTKVHSTRQNGGYTFAWDDFPATLKQEVDAYFAARTTADPFDRTTLKPLAPLSARGQHFQLRQAASAMVHKQAASRSDLTDLVALVNPERVKAGLRFFYERSGQQCSTQLTQIANALHGVARYLLEQGRIEQCTFNLIHDAYKKVEYRSSGMAERNRERLRPFADPANVEALLFLPDRLLQQCGKSAATTTDAYRVRTALAVELLLVFPMRVRNLATLDIDAHIHRTQTAGAGRTFIDLPGMEVKNGEALQVELPRRSAKLLDLYIHAYRPLLIRDNGTWLFPGGNGGHPHAAAFGTYLKRAIHRETGLTIHPHLFRHIAAKLYLDANPGQFEVVRQVLGHRSLKTTVDTYAEFDSQQAIQMYDREILRLREQVDSDGQCG